MARRLTDEPIDRVGGHNQRASTAVNPAKAEVLDHLVRLAGAHEEAAALDPARLGLLEGIVVDCDLALAAGRLRLAATTEAGAP